MRSTQSLTASVKDEVLQWIRDGKFPAGSQLPAVNDLAKKLSVSRTVIREALQSLVGMKLVDIRPGLGCFVRSVPPELIVNADVVAALLDMKTLIEVAQARKAIEGAVARLAVVTATPDDFEELESKLYAIERAVKKSQPMFSHTPAFHVAIARATHNQILEKVVSSFNSLMAAAGHVIEQVHFGSDYRKAEYESHAKLLAVLRGGDPAKAQSEMENHIQKTVDELIEIKKLEAEKFAGAKLVSA